MSLSFDLYKGTARSKQKAKTTGESSQQVPKIRKKRSRLLLLEMFPRPLLRSRFQRLLAES